MRSDWAEGLVKYRTGVIAFETSTAMDHILQYKRDRNLTEYAVSEASGDL